MSILAFTGNRFLAESTLQSTLTARQLRPADFPRLGGEDVNAQTLQPHLSAGLFGDGGLIVDFEGVKPDKALLELLGKAEVTVAILDESPPATRLKFYEAKGEIISSATPSKPAEVVAWVTQYAKKQNLKLEKEAISYFAEIFGSDLVGIASEFNKLVLLGGTFNREEVQRIVGREPPGDSFALLAAATSGKTPEALTQFKRLMASGEDPFKLMGLLVWQYSLVARCVGLMQEEGRINETLAAQRLGLKPFAAKKALDVARRLNEAKIRAHLSRILEADHAMKRGLDATVTMERLLIQLSM